MLIDCCFCTQWESEIREIKQTITYRMSFNRILHSKNIHFSFWSGFIIFFSSLMLYVSYLLSNNTPHCMQWISNIRYRSRDNGINQHDRRAWYFFFNAIIITRTPDSDETPRIPKNNNKLNEHHERSSIWKIYVNSNNCPY